MFKSLPCARACARTLRKTKLLAQGTCARTRARNLRKETRARLAQNSRKEIVRKSICLRSSTYAIRMYVILYLCENVSVCVFASLRKARARLAEAIPRPMRIM